MIPWIWFLTFQIDPLTAQLDAEMLLSQGKWKEARALLEQVYQETADPYFLTMLAEGAFDAQDYKTLLRIVERVEAKGDSIPSEVWDRALRAAYILDRKDWIEQRMDRILSMRDPNLLRLLADIFQNWDDYERSAHLYQQAFQVQQDPDILYYLGYALLEIGKVDSARQVFEELIQQGDTLRGAKGLALVYKKQGDQEKEREMLELAHKIQPGNPQVLFRLAQIYIQMKKFDQAYPLLEALIQFDPFAYPYRYLLAQTYYQDKRYRRAMVHLSTLVYLYPNRPNLHDLLARVWLEMRQPHLAIQEARKAYSLAKQPDQKRGYRSFLAFLYLVTRQPSEAISLLSYTPIPFLSDTEVIFLAEAYVMRRDTLRAVRVLAQSTRHRTDPTFLIEAAQRLYRWDRIDDAERIVQRVLAVDPENLDAHFLQALIATDKGDIETAEKAYTFLIERDSTDPTYYNNLGYLLLTTGRDLERARKLIARALEINPDEPAYLDSMGWYYFLVGNLGQAKSYLDRAYVKGGKRDWEILDHLGDLYARLGQQDEALRYYREALNFAPADAKEKIRKKIEALR